LKDFGSLIPAGGICSMLELGETFLGIASAVALRFIQFPL